MLPPLQIPDRRTVIEEHKAAGGGVAAVFPIHYPRALLRAFGLLPVEVWGPPGADPNRAGSHLQAYTCGIVRNGMAFLLSGGLDVADVIVVPHACDSLQGLASVLMDFVQPDAPPLTLYMPREKRRSDYRFLREEIAAKAAWLAAKLGREPSETEWREAIEAEEAADAQLRSLAERRTALPLSNFDYYRLVRSREYLPAERFSALAAEVLEQAREDLPVTGVPLLMSGIVPEPMALLEVLDDAGAVVVGDDMACNGRRHYPAGSSSDPFARMAEALLGGPPDPMLGSPIVERIDFIVGLARSRGAKGVIFQRVKFCEPELFDLPELRKGLENAGLPSVDLEVDLGEPLAHQLVTRLEAFVEMIG